MTDEYRRIRLYGDFGTVFDHSPPYKNLIEWAWDGLDDIESIDMAKTVADALIDEEIARHGGTVVFGKDGYIEFPDAERRMAFLLKWG
jgi:hypothetical protein